MTPMRMSRFGELDCRVVQGDAGAPKHAVILCHGFGAPADDLVSLAEVLMDEAPSLATGVQFLFPAAPIKLDAYGLPGSRAWWMIDVGRFQRAAQQGQEALLHLAKDIPAGLVSARDLFTAGLEGYLKETGLKLGDIALGGFSQGAMVTTDVTMRSDVSPAALGIFSGTVIAETEWRELAPKRAGLEVLMSHGTMDTILPFFGAERLRALMSEAGLPVDFVPFAGPHTIVGPALSRFAELLVRKFG